MSTIAAVATSAGSAGVGIIRVSGSEALPVVGKVFKPYAGGLQARVATLGRVEVPGVVDEAIVIYFQAPNSFTGEDVVEIQAHGGSFLLGKILEHLFELGAVPASAGEFSRRAFLNGKMSLGQAEAVMDLISAQSDAELRAASSGFAGTLLRKLGAVEGALTTALARIEVVLDHPEMGMEGELVSELGGELEQISLELEQLIATEQQGRIIRDGVQIAVLGRPNVGKSSLFNAILGRERSIVTEISGTTTDTVSESILYRGYRLVFNDTAGIREGASVIEKMGIERSKKLTQDADVCLVILDGSCAMTEEDGNILRLVEGRPTIIALNKSDLGRAKLPREFVRPHEGETSYENSCSGYMQVSAKTGENIEALKEAIFNKVVGAVSSTLSQDLTVTNARHMVELKGAYSALLGVIELLGGPFPTPLDLVAGQVAEALRCVGRISGTNVSEGVIDEIFSRFCLGK